LLLLLLLLGGYGSCRCGRDAPRLSAVIIVR
jgi:hypothetical protein